MKTYKKDKIQVQHNQKTGEAGTIDIHRGCKGCEISKMCYAAKGARRTGIDFFQPIRREFDKSLLEKQLKRYNIDWVRIGCISDPSLDWNTTCKVTELVHAANKTPVVITKLFNSPTAKQLRELVNTHSNLQISVCGATPAEKIATREGIASASVAAGLDVSWRINSAIWKPNSKQEKTQNALIEIAEALEIPIIDTPLRLFKTSPFWKLVDQKRYHRHLSPISGKLDNQKTAGLIIPDAYPCFSTCSKFPTKHDKFACDHQCLTELSKRMMQ